jgi:hypothetical protein
MKVGGNRGWCHWQRAETNLRPSSCIGPVT